MSECKKLFRPFWVLFILLYIGVLMVHLYTQMYYGEYATRSSSIQFFRHAVEQKKPTQWLKDYRGNILARIEEAQRRYMSSSNQTEKSQLREDIAQELESWGTFDYLGREMLVLNRLIRKFEHIDGLNVSWSKETELARRALKRKGLKSEVEDSFSDLHPPEYGNYQPFDDLVSWNKTYGWLVMGLIMIVCTMPFSQEYHSGMNALIYVQAIHPERVSRRKILTASFLTVGLITLQFTLSLLITGHMAGGLTELLQPAQALDLMGVSSLPVNILTVILYQYIAYLCAGLCIGGIALLTSTVIYNAKGALLTCCTIIGLPQLCANLISNMKWLDARSYLGVVDLMQRPGTHFIGVSAGLLILGLALAIGASIRFARRCVRC